jgi:hypothetical protein
MRPVLIQNSSEGVQKVANCFLRVVIGRIRDAIVILERNILDVEV